ncbi:MAG: hypothetical protein ABJM58_14515 [Alteripontixanthobacter sp.]
MELPAIELPKIDAASLPDLDTATGVFGSLSDFASAFSDDRIVIVMVYVYDTMPPERAGIF